MRAATGLGAALALAAAATLPTAALAGPTPSDGAARAASADGGLGAAAIAAVRAHPAAASVGDRTAFEVTAALLDRDGDTHVRMERTYAGLPVRGGDLVVHRSASGAWEGVSATLDAAPALSTTPAVGRAAAVRAALAGAETARGAQAGSSTLVVDAFSGTGRLAWEVVTGGTHADGTPSRLSTFVDARSGEVLRTGSDPDGRRLRPVPLRRHRPPAADARERHPPAEGPDPRQHLHDRPGQQDDADACQLFGHKCPTGTLFTSPGHLLRQRVDAQPRVGRGRRAVRHQRDLGLLQGRPRPQRHLRRRSRAPTTACTTATTTSTRSGTARR